ncbi:hypothetical protein OXIME_001107 [Oxyplasma meridianum]|uniref:Polymerase nucleotidyl transferase domain-containing protein n=1 Tax=Oxyplasma meridianum TaxID=3073602 RepID=A0AAX4NHA7_9ARCH
MSQGDIKDSKICVAREFFKLLGTRDLLFLGISGSVSYDPEPDDDVDIFIITKSWKLWITIIRAMIIRRIHGLYPICLSLCLDSVSAKKMFDESRDFIVAMDSLHVIPLFGDSYYNKLMRGSKLIKNFFPDEFKAYEIPVLEHARFNLQNCALYFFSAVYLELKGLIHNHRYESENKREKCFKTVLGFHSFYLDSIKYQKLRELHQEPGDSRA